MRLQQTVPPAAEPVTLADAKAHCRIDIADDDAYVSLLITAARMVIESRTWRQLCTATWLMVLDYFPSDDGDMLHDDVLLIPKSPIQSVTSITYYDPLNNFLTWATAQYDVDLIGEPARVYPSLGFFYPVTREKLNAVQITFVAGYGNDGTSVPEPLKTAIKWLVAYWYQQRESASVAALKPIPFGVDSIIRQYSLGWLL